MGLLLACFLKPEWREERPLKGQNSLDPTVHIWGPSSATAEGPGGGHSLPKDCAHGPGAGPSDNGQNEP